jgi:hypothetical protein
VESLHFDKVVDFYQNKDDNHLKKFRELRKKTQKNMEDGREGGINKLLV